LTTNPSVSTIVNNDHVQATNRDYFEGGEEGVSSKLSSVLELGCGCGLIGIWLQRSSYQLAGMSHHICGVMDGITKIYMTDKINQLQLTRCNIDINNFVLRRRCDVDNIRRSGSSSSNNNNDISSSNSNSSSCCNNNNNNNNNSSSDENCYVFNNYNASVSDTDNNDRCDGLELI
jgi:hypothetical protein